ncbi:MULTISPECIES: hypothetical protein [unclassified Polaromonas]|jgi:hypothetical protein|uniref:hypothetical protein n=1 Tax=unclassified Polaromonas TaxID=2638319 RepID=UPI000BD38AD3|nr:MULTISPECIES: hypothetical protein [unclassified Polaromonas]OYY34790.1 MAG: hypothetical protein B7Y60_15235 [Polaromonas sp. 35-63-35]OYZ19323.1 MAG: hypothetical protein B7Y28_12355 [Polaromonas sp. 16-63-31]OYZ77551.1 MAG: hypothetical protein B7Y09_16395 [Polaromonas sp. 24-63-21]OZA48466.1 MAG: hypothetical protein B7X88_18125 [Polaromonas sp. 17-63-33]OZA87214.1 MAG: hypothetical protein B7X65_13595 [Polaromonas sp. 39-63-25]
MAGLLDALNTDEARLGLGLLAAGGYSPTPMSFGQRIQSAMQGQDAQKRGALQNKLLQSQVDENASQAQLRQQQLLMAQKEQELDAQFMGGGLLGASPAAPGAMPGAAGPAAPGGQAAPAGGFTAQQISQQFGIPYEAVVADYKFNGGKKISELISERTKPNWQNVNGNLVNTSAPGFTGGMQGGMASSADGKVTAWQPDGQGGLVVGAPKGALDTFRAYQGASADFKPIRVFNPATQREEFTSEGAVVRPAPALNRSEAGMRADAQGNMGADPAGIQREIKAVQTDLATKPLDPGSRAQLQAHLADLQQAAKVTPMPSGNMAAGPSAAEATKAATDKEYAVNATKDIGETRKTIMNAGFSAPSTIAKYQQLGKLLQDVDGGTLTATGTNIASAMNSLGFKIDKNLSNKEAAAALGNEMALELRNPANGAGMPGAMSDADRNYLVSMIPNASQSAQGRAQLLAAKIAVEQRKVQTATFARNYEKKYGRLDNGFFEQMSAWSNQNPLFKGK